jgi:hypothetical protein
MASTLTEAARLLTTHDSDGDRSLDRQEFDEFVVGLARAAGYGDAQAVLGELLQLSRQADSKRLSKVLDAQAGSIEAALL